MTHITAVINGKELTLPIPEDGSLLATLRAAGYLSVKRGCDCGSCGTCTVLVDGHPVRGCMLRAAEIDGHQITTVEGLEANGELDPIQQAFVEAGAIQCGYCTPGLLLATKALLDGNPHPTEDAMREALSGVLCRCTGYVRVVEAVERAASALRGETMDPITFIEGILPTESEALSLPAGFRRQIGENSPLPPLVLTPPEIEPTRTVGQPLSKVDGVKLARGRPVFTDDLSASGSLYGALLASPHAHARILDIDASRARALEGVHAVLTHEDLPRVKFASG